MFATCMPFQVTCVLCVILWVTFPDVKGREILPTVFPGFKMVTVGNFIYGFFASMVYGGPLRSSSSSSSICGRNSWQPFSDRERCDTPKPFMNVSALALSRIKAAAF